MQESRTLPVLQIERPVDNTALQAYMACPREYYFAMVLHRRGEGRSPALVFGTAWHAAMEAHYRTGGNPEEVKEAIEAGWEGHDSADDYRTKERVWLDYIAYVKKYGLPKYENAKTLGWPDEPMIEMSVNAGDEDLIYPWAGKLDRIIDSDNLLYVEDHKTTSRLDKNFWSQWTVSQQMMGYTFLGQRLVPGRRLVGVRVNVTHVLKNKTEFHRQLFTFTPEQIRGFKDNTNVWFRRLNRDYELLAEGSPDAFPGHYGDNGCNRKYGLCVYHKICGASPRLRMSMLERDFPVQNPWNPLETKEADGE